MHPALYVLSRAGLHQHQQNDLGFAWAIVKLASNVSSSDGKTEDLLNLLAAELGPESWVVRRMREILQESVTRDILSA